MQRDVNRIGVGRHITLIVAAASLAACGQSEFAQQIAAV